MSLRHKNFCDEETFTAELLTLIFRKPMPTDTLPFYEGHPTNNHRHRFFVPYTYEPKGAFDEECNLDIHNAVTEKSYALHAACEIVLSD